MGLEVMAWADEPFMSLPCMSVASGGRRIVPATIPVHMVTVKGLPEGLDALLVCSDMQFVDTVDVPVGMRRLMGSVVASELSELGWHEVLPHPLRTGVLLAGDFYVRPDLSKRGGDGDVTEIWRSFAGQYAWVAGVAGNHDRLGQGAGDVVEGWLRRGSSRVLDGEVVDFGGLKVGGVCGVLGKSKKLWRRPLKRYRQLFKQVLDQRPDVIVLHEPPQPMAPHKGEGRLEIFEILARSGQSPLVVCGHNHWSQPWAPQSDGPDILNVDARVVILRRDDATA